MNLKRTRSRRFKRQWNAGLFGKLPLTRGLCRHIMKKVIY